MKVTIKDKCEKQESKTYTLDEMKAQEGKLFKMLGSYSMHFIPMEGGILAINPHGAAYVISDGFANHTFIEVTDKIIEIDTTK